MTTLHIHLGPHKTGTTAIQRLMSDEASYVKQEFGLIYFDDQLIKEGARLLNRSQIDEAKILLSKAERLIDGSEGDILISNEDLAGDLPGRTGKRRPYPKLWENMKVLKESFSRFDCKFYFFVRDPEYWISSAYHQLVKHRDRFHSLNEYKDFLKRSELWDEVLQKPRGKIPGEFFEIAYQEGEGFSSPTSLLEFISGRKVPKDDPRFHTRSNESPSGHDVKILEIVSSSGSSNHAKRVARAQILKDGLALPEINPDDLIFPDWPARPPRPEWLADDLHDLWQRSSQRVHTENQELFLPDPFADLSAMRTNIVHASDEFPTGGRASLENQQRIIRYRFRNKPEICYILGMTISYLRRDTAHTEHAAFLFQRIWEEEYPVLLATLPTRWLISTFQSFMDHGISSEQRSSGAAAYFYSNILKAYEAERALDGLAADAVYPSPTPTTKSGFDGLDRFKLGGTDLMLNTNALLLEHAARDSRCGRVIQEFLLRLKNSHSMFSRMDQSRISHDVKIKQFDNCWSFFQKPKKG